MHFSDRSTPINISWHAFCSDLPLLDFETLLEVYVYSESQWRIQVNGGFLQLGTKNGSASESERNVWTRRSHSSCGGTGTSKIALLFAAEYWISVRRKTHTVLGGLDYAHVLV